MHARSATSGRSAPKNAPETSHHLAGGHSGAEGRPLMQQVSAVAWHRTHQQLKWKLFPQTTRGTDSKQKGLPGGMSAREQSRSLRALPVCGWAAAPPWPKGGWAGVPG